MEVRRRPFRRARLSAWRALAVGVIALVGVPGAARQTSDRADLRQKLRTCEIPGVTEPAFCGGFEVPEVRDEPRSRRLSLNVVVLPATREALSDPLIFLPGGGVVPATRYAAFLNRALPELRRNRDVVLVDQRGTWNSNPLACDRPMGSRPGEISELAVMRACQTALSTQAVLGAYSTAAAMDDLDAVRQWLGYPVVNLYGVSYGTKAAQVYLKQYPTRVRSAVLYGVVPLAASSQLDLAKFAQRSLERVFALCAADADCRSAFGRLPTEFEATLDRLTRSAAAVTIDRAEGGSQTIEITDRLFRNVVQTMLGSARRIERLPLLVHAAYGGDYGPIARAVLGDGPPPPRPAPRGLFYSILCGESIPLIDRSQVAPATAGTFFGDAPVRSQMDVCATWPRAVLPKTFWDPARVDVPVLALTGDLDPITPASYGDQVTGSLTKARHIVLPNRSHDDVDPCITSLFQQFIVAGGASGLDTSCVSTPPPLRFAIR